MTAYPATVKIYPCMAFIAEQYKGYGGAFKLYTFARRLDGSGSGQVRRDDLQAYILSLGKVKKTFDRWLAVAIKIGIVRECRGGEVLAYVSMARAAFALGARDFLGGRTVEIDAKEFAGRKWRAEVWNGQLATTRGRPITRAKLQGITGKAPSTQRRYEKRLTEANKVKKITNWHEYTGEEVNEHPQAALAAFKEFKHGGAFIVRLDNGQLAIETRGPNSYVTSAVTARKGRSRKVNKALRRLVWLERNSGLSNVRRAMSYGVLPEEQDGQARPYLYQETEAQGRIARMIAARMDNPPACFFRLRTIRDKGNRQHNYWTAEAYTGVEG